MNLLNVIDAHAGGVAGCAFLPDGVQAVSGGADKTVKLWNLTTGQAVKTFGPLPDAVTAVAVSKDGLQVGAAAGKTVKAWTVADGKEAATLTHPAEVAGLSFSADKTKIATAAADGLSRDLGRGDGAGIAGVPARRGRPGRGLTTRAPPPSLPAARTRRRRSRRSTSPGRRRSGRRFAPWRRRRTGRTS